MSPSRLTTTPLPRPPSRSDDSDSRLVLRLDEHQGRPDGLIDEFRERGRRGDRGEGIGHDVVDVRLGQRRRSREGCVEQDRDEDRKGARGERQDPSGPRSEAAGAWRRIRRRSS